MERYGTVCFRVALFLCPVTVRNPAIFWMAGDAKRDIRNKKFDFLSFCY
ncbi:hypothetical protein HMPREF9166_0902 [Selenomonas sp. oral taxon 149 str. 67H29BP]|nr:hypothetical protein HMPREF9166_0902 [Selenomonas sp. oral taxon 149 str. 67H29BP]